MVAFLKLVANSMMSGYLDRVNGDLIELTEEGDTDNSESEKKFEESEKEYINYFVSYGLWYGESTITQLSRVHRWNAHPGEILTPPPEQA